MGGLYLLHHTHKYIYICIITSSSVLTWEVARSLVIVVLRVHHHKKKFKSHHIGESPLSHPSSHNEMLYAVRRWHAIFHDNIVAGSCIRSNNARPFPPPTFELPHSRVSMHRRQIN